MAKNTRARYWFITFNKGCETYNEVEKVIHELAPSKWGFISHKRGEEQEHKHLVVAFRNARYFSSLKEICKGANIDNIHSSFELSLQYLIHKNNPEKESYSIEEVSSNLSTEELKRVMEFKQDKRIYYECNTTNILEDYESGTNARDLLLKYGVDNYHKVISILKDLDYLPKRFRNENELLNVINQQNQTIDKLTKRNQFLENQVRDLINQIDKDMPF